MATLLLIYLTVFINSINHVSSRTCVCAEFMADECDGHLNCKFNLVQPTAGEIHGSHGICRSLKWYTCHVDPKCTIKYRDPNSNWELIDSDKMPSEEDDRDWPWDCITGDYSPYMMNVKELEFATMDLKKINVKQEEKDIIKESFVFKPGHNGSNMRMATEITCGVLIIGFIFLICGIMVILKCKDRCFNVSEYDKSHNPLLTKV